MRDDMKKVVTERPRVGGMITYRHIRRQNSSDDLPSYEGMRFPYNRNYRRKEFSDLIGPLLRYLRSNVRRPWNDVWSEICQNLKMTSTIQQHIRDHVTYAVDRYAVVNDNGEAVDLRGNTFTTKEFYVHPVTGILCVGKKPRYKGIKKKYEDFHNFGNEMDAFKIDGIWYWAVYSTVPNESLIRRDINGNIISETVINKTHMIYSDQEKDKYSWRHNVPTFAPGQRYRSGKRQMSREDLKKYNLVND